MATVPTYRTWVTGEVVTAAYLNSNVRDAGNFWLAVPVFEGRQTAAQSIGNGAFTVVLLDTEDIDNDSMHSTVTNISRVTAVTAGRYQFAGLVAFVANAGGQRANQWWLNGAAVNAGETTSTQLGATQTDSVARTRTILMAANDYVELAGWQNTGAALNTTIVGTDQSSMSARWVGTT